MALDIRFRTLQSAEVVECSVLDIPNPRCELLSCTRRAPSSWVLQVPGAEIYLEQHNEMEDDR